MAAGKWIETKTENRALYCVKGFIKDNRTEI